MTDRTIAAVSAIECSMVEATWDFATDNAERIDRHWDARRARTPELFNGRVLLLRHGALVGAGRDTVFEGACFETDFKPFMAWREFGFPPSNARNIFSMAALETTDGAFVLGEMAAHTAPAGQIYFPSGTPDRSDVHAGRVDIEGSAARELAEETGLDPDDADFLPGAVLVMDRIRVCCMKRVKVDQSAEALVDHIHAWLARETKPELARMHIVRGPADFSPAMPDFVTAYMADRFART